MISEYPATYERYSRSAPIHNDIWLPNEIHVTARSHSSSETIGSGSCSHAVPSLSCSKNNENDCLETRRACVCTLFDHVTHVDNVVRFLTVECILTFASE